MKKIILFALTVLMVSCTAVDSGDVGIKFKKFSVDDQGDFDGVSLFKLDVVQSVYYVCVHLSETSEHPLEFLEEYDESTFCGKVVKFFTKNR